MQGGQNEYYFYANDKPLGSTGSNGVADFDFNYTPVSDRYPATTPGSYVVGQGDTLRSIAAAMFGDAGLWYLVADANGISSDSQLVIGRSLTIPNKISNLHNNYQTFKPYAPGEIIGDTTPTLPDPPPPPAASGGGGCGGIGTLIVAVVAIVATILTAGAALTALAPTSAGLGTGLAASWSAGVGLISGSVAGVSGGMLFAAGAIGGAVGSIVSQGVGIAIGAQQKFSWSGVAVSALSAGFTAGTAGGQVGKALGIASAGGKLVAGAIANNVFSQGLNIISGQQDKFNWKGVAAAAIAAPVAQAVGGADVFKGSEFGKFAGQFASGLTSGVIRQAIGGRVDFVNVAADAFGNALGFALAGTSSTGDQTAELNKAKAEVAGADAPWGVNPRTNSYRDGLMVADANNVNDIVSDALSSGVRIEVVGAGLKPVSELPDGTAIYQRDGESGLVIPNLPAGADVPEMPGYSVLSVSDDRSGRWVEYAPTQPNYSGSYIPANAPEGYQPPVIGDYGGASGSIQAMGWWDGVFTFNPAGRLARGAGNAILESVKTVPTVIREFAYTAGDVGGYVASAAPWVPKHQPMSALFQTLERDGPAPIVRGLVGATVGPFKHLHDGVLFGRYEEIGEGGIGLAGAALGLRGARVSGSVPNNASILESVSSKGIGYGSGRELRTAMSPGPGEQIHHIVEQTSANIARFGEKTIHNIANAVPVAADIHIGKGSVSAFYSSKQPFTGDLTVRQWLKPQSFDEQYIFGTQVLKDFGVIK